MFFVAIVAGFAGIWTIETVDRTIRSSRDLVTVSNGQLIVAIPYIATKAELKSKKSRITFVIGALAAILLIALIAIHLLWRPLDELWPILLVRLGL
jgi:hypothetical protein